MPGLLRGMARTAVVAGTATAVSNRVSRRQANRWADQGQGAPAYMAETEPQQYEQQQYAPPPPAPAAPAADPIEQLKELAALREQGVLTDEEFAVQKSKILGRT
jgi:Short C-terminal domain